MLDLTMTLEQQLRLRILSDAIPTMTTQQIVDQLIDAIKSSMLISNQSDELSLSQEFELHQMKNVSVGREDAINLLLEAQRQLMIKKNVVSQFNR